MAPNKWKISVPGVRYCNSENWSFYDQNIRNRQLSKTNKNEQISNKVRIVVCIYIFTHSNLQLSLPFQNRNTSMNIN
jgi:hypothetical protein